MVFFHPIGHWHITDFHCMWETSCCISFSQGFGSPFFLREKTMVTGFFPVSSFNYFWTSGYLSLPSFSVPIFSLFPVFRTKLCIVSFA
jgi:hypothetical protein